MKIGTYYYPEQWPRAQWQRDFDNIARMGLQIVHMGEFAWLSMEPRMGKFDLDWLDECVELAAQRDLDVILCTPTAVPPIWLEMRHPEIMVKFPDGRSARHGGRRHAAHTAPAFIDATRRIVTALADRFGGNSAVIGWQLDNEYGSPFAQNDHAHEAFREWLKKKYVTIDALNDAWGCQFWNTQYLTWNEIFFPESRETAYRNPHQNLDASRFWSWSFAEFSRVQAEILKPRIGNRFLTTNFMPFHLDCDPGDMTPSLTMSTWDSYPVTGWDKTIADQTFRIADPVPISLMHDQMACYQNRWALMELQPGHVNWTGVPVRLFEGAIRLWIWTAFAHGAEFVTTYRFRQPRFGIELFHHGLVGTDGVTPTQGGREFAQTISEMKKLDLSRVPALAEETIDPKRMVGLVLDFEQLWYYATLPQARRWNQARWLQMWYGAFCRLGIGVKILRPGQVWPADLKMIVAPGVQMVDAALVEQMSAYAKGGGHLVLTCRTGLMDRHGQLFEGPTAMPILPLIGGTIVDYDGLPDDCFGKIVMGGKGFDWGVWGDQIEPGKDVEVVARYADQFYAGAAAVTRNKIGKGEVSYFGAYSEKPMVDAFVAGEVKRMGLLAEALAERVHVLRRGVYRIALNYRDEPVIALAAKGARFLVGSREIEPAGVAVWEE